MVPLHLFTFLTPLFLLVIFESLNSSSRFRQVAPAILTCLLDWPGYYAHSLVIFDYDKVFEIDFLSFCLFLQSALRFFLSYFQSTQDQQSWTKYLQTFSHFSRNSLNQNWSRVRVTTRVIEQFKVGLSPSKKIVLFASLKMLLKNYEKCFLFHLKSSFPFQDT